MDKSQIYDVMKKASAAIQLDTENKLNEAFHGYLTCLLSVVEGLLRSLTLDGQNVITANRMVKQAVQVGQQCMDRVATILHDIESANNNTNSPIQQSDVQARSQSFTMSAPALTPTSEDPRSHSFSTSRGSHDQKTNTGTNINSMVNTTQATNPHTTINSPAKSNQATITVANKSTPINTTQLTNTTTNIHAPQRQPADNLSHNRPVSVELWNKKTPEGLSNTQNRPISLNVPEIDTWNIPPLPADPESIPRKRMVKSLKSPVEVAKIQNQHLMAVYRLRMAKLTPPKAADLNLTLQRKMAENLAIARDREQVIIKRIRERQNRLEEEASSVIGRVIRKVEADKATAIMLVPHWPTSVWFPHLQRLLVKKPIHLRWTSTLLTLPSSQMVHPLGQKLRLTACLVSGKI